MYWYSFTVYWYSYTVYWYSFSVFWYSSTSIAYIDTPNLCTDTSILLTGTIILCINTLTVNCVLIPLYCALMLLFLLLYCVYVLLYCALIILYCVMIPPTKWKENKQKKIERGREIKFRKKSSSQKVSRVIKENFKVVCFNGVSRNSQEFFDGALGMFQGGFKSTSKSVFSRNHKCVSLHFQGCFKDASRKFQGSV